VGALGFGNLLPQATAPDTAALLVTPLLQAAAFLVLDGLFRFRMGRVPLTYLVARYGQAPRQERPLPDRLFWAAVLVVLVLLGLLLCRHFGVRFPSRHSAS
jgi:hypothetical protein